MNISKTIEAMVEKYTTPATLMILCMAIAILHAWIEGMREAMMYHFTASTPRSRFPWSFDEHDAFATQRSLFYIFMMAILNIHFGIISSAVATCGIGMMWALFHDGSLYCHRNDFNPLVYKKRFWASKEKHVDDGINTIEMSGTLRAIMAIAGLLICVLCLHLKHI